jgi:hypothetical protein
MHSAILEFWPFCMKIEKAALLFYFRKILNFFDLDLFVLVSKTAPRWVFIKFVFGLEIIRDFQNFNGDFVWKIWLIANFAECGSKPWKGYLITVRRQILSFFFMIRWNSRSIDFSIQNRGKNFENRELYLN